MFNKDTFAQLLDKAKGKDRSINRFALESSISAAHISRLLRGMINTPPGPDTIKQLAEVANNGVTYEQLMESAGYIKLYDNSNKSENDSETLANILNYISSLSVTAPELELIKNNIKLKDNPANLHDVFKTIFYNTNEDSLTINFNINKTNMINKDSKNQIISHLTIANTSAFSDSKKLHISNSQVHICPEAIPDIMKFLMRPGDELWIEYDNINDVNTPEKQKAAILKMLKKTKALEFQPEFEKQIALLPNDLRKQVGKNISLYDFFIFVENNKETLSKISIYESMYKEVDIDQMVNLPIMRLIKCEKPVWSQEENIEGYYPTSKHDLNMEDFEYFFLRVPDNSMDKEFKVGGLVLIQKQGIIDNGEIGVLTINNSNSIIRKVFIKDNLITLMPQSNSPEYMPQIFDMTKETVEIIGKVTLAIKKY